jgi:hypothetical protein
MGNTANIVRVLHRDCKQTRPCAPQDRRPEHGQLRGPLPVSRCIRRAASPGAVEGEANELSTSVIWFRLIRPPTLAEQPLLSQRSIFLNISKKIILKYCIFAN